ncbi:hypothetical protein DPMN_095059 [Dreissena polymorpha]|uniref:Uncharacterized protein n=1 Tax=Dreissena polymorpha TaxID=45954 RepID=A0A9D4L669_DREPO|nr:hypothetical protein DPMN_095059 [Dreissena polymorpha]
MLQSSLLVNTFRILLYHLIVSLRHSTVGRSSGSIIRKLTNINVAEKCPAPGGNVFQATQTIFELIQDIIGTNLLTKFHDDRKINVTSRIITRFYCSHIRKNAPPPGGHIGLKMWPLEKNAPSLGSHVFQAKVIIFELIQDIIETNLRRKFHEDWKINVASRVLTRFIYSHIRKNAPPPGGHVFQPTNIIRMNLLTKFHEDQTINVASRVKNAPPLGRRVFQANVTIFELIQDIIETNLLTKFHED